MKLYDHQQEAMEKSLEKLNKYNMCFFMCEERFGKTLTALSALKEMGKEKVLFVTVKAAIKSIAKDYEMGEFPFSIKVINYESLHKVTDTYDAIIFDESTKLSKYPKPAQSYKKAKEIIDRCKKPTIIWLNATPSVESMSQWFHQLQVASVWPEKNFYKWFKNYGIPTQIFGAGGIPMASYNSTKSGEVWRQVSPIIVKGTRESAGFEHFQTEVRRHVVPLTSAQEYIMDKIAKEKVYEGIIADSATKQLSKLHQISGGFVLDDNGIVVTVKANKLQYLKDNIYGRVAIYANYRAEIDYLTTELGATNNAEEFQNGKNDTLVLQIKTGSKGIDLSMADQHWIYSTNFSGETFAQALNRMHNKKRMNKVIVDTVEAGALDQRVFDAVLNKRDYNTAMFREDF